MTQQELDQILALPAGRELDAAVARYIFGWTSVDAWTGNEAADADWIGVPPGGMEGFFEGQRKSTFDWLPCYSADMATAWQVFTHHCMTSQVIGFTVHSPQDRPDLTDIDYLGYAREWICTCQGKLVMASTAPLVICRAALKTVLSKER